MRLTRVFGLVHDPEAVSHAYLVLVAALGDIVEAFGKDEIRRSCLLLVYIHLQRLPRWVTERCDNVDRRLHTRLGEGYGRAFGHGDMGYSRSLLRNGYAGEGIWAIYLFARLVECGELYGWLS